MDYRLIIYLGGLISIISVSVLSYLLLSEDNKIFKYLFLDEKNRPEKGWFGASLGIGILWPLVLVAVIIYWTLELLSPKRWEAILSSIREAIHKKKVSLGKRG